MRLFHIVGIILMTLALFYVGANFKSGLTLGGLASLEVLAFGMDYVSHKVKSK